MMNKIRTLVKKYAVLTYFILTFLITWGSIFLMVGSVGFPLSKAQIDAAGPMIYIGMLLGPSLAGLLMIGLVDGKAGFRNLFSRLFKWRVNIKWYLIAIFTVPVLVLTILFLLSLKSSEFLPAILSADNKTSLLITGIVMGLAVAFFEEIGWTGFVVPKLRQKRSVLFTGLLVGLLWGAWHYPPFSPSGSDAEILPQAVYLAILLFSFLPAYRILLTWIYDRTQSMLLVILMHAPLSACQLILIPPTLSGPKMVIYDLIFGASLWILAIIVLVKSKKELK